MFTGIIEETGSLLKMSNGKIKIACNKILEDMKIGDSISTNGICLTVTHFDDKSFSADVMPETIRRTSLENLKAGDTINLERALRVSDRLGGHVVSGHIDGVGTIKSMIPEKNAIIITVKTEKKILRYIATKGSIALDGMSLTVVNAGENDFSVSLIPHTRDVTNFKYKKVGSLINIEVDVMARYIERLMNFKATTISKDFLLENGF